MRGTTFSVTRAILLTPPKKTKPAMRNPESGVEGVSDGVGLDHVAYKAQCQNEGYREETCQEFTEFPFK